MQLFRASAHNVGGSLSGDMQTLSGARAYETGEILTLYGKEYISAVTNSDDKVVIKDAKESIAQGGSKLYAASDVADEAHELVLAKEYARAAPLYAYAASLYKQTPRRDFTAIAQKNEAKCYLRLAIQASTAGNIEKARSYAREAVALYPIAAANAVAAGEYKLSADIALELAGAKAIDVAIKEGKDLLGTAKKVDAEVSVSKYEAPSLSTPGKTNQPEKTNQPKKTSQKKDNTLLYVAGALALGLLFLRRK